jgi:hypothetical protein
MASAGIKRLTMWIIAVSVFGAAPAVRSNCGRAGGHGERQTDRGYNVTHRPLSLQMRQIRVTVTTRKFHLGISDMPPSRLQDNSEFID